MRVTLPMVLLAAVLTPGWAMANAGGTKPPEVVEGPAAAIDGDASAPETVEAPVTAVPVPAAEGASWYDELKDWAGILVPAIVIVAAAWLGFRGVRQTRKANAKMAREQAEEAQVRERRRRLTSKG